MNQFFELLFPEPAVVLVDANVLYQATTRDLMIRLAMAGLVRVRWSEQILDECFDNLLLDRPDLSRERLSRTRGLMNKAIRDALVVGYERHIGGLALPDPGDRHVLAAAIEANAEVILTFNLKDFPSSSLLPHGVVALHPDEWLLEVIERAPSRVLAVLEAQAAQAQRPPNTLEGLFLALEQRGLVRSVAALRTYLAQGEEG